MKGEERERGRGERERGREKRTVCRGGEGGERRMASGQPVSTTGKSQGEEKRIHFAFSMQCHQREEVVICIVFGE